MHILIIAPSAPPKNSAEAIQIGRYLAELDRHHKITLITTPVEKGWVTEDTSLRLQCKNIEVITISLPYHRFSKRFLTVRWLQCLYVPDGDFWLQWKVGEVIRRLKNRPDVIYSRSFPLSSAMLAWDLKVRLGVSWIMHLSDPWVDSPYRELASACKNRDQSYESNCFSAADAISVTTDGLAQHYRAKFSARASDIFVSPNVMPNESRKSVAQKGDGKLKIVYTGAFYRWRRPTDILKAMNLIAAHRPELLDRITVDFYGNATEDILNEISASRLPQVTAWGRISLF